VIGESGKNRFIAHGNAVTKCSPEQLRPASAHESAGGCMPDKLRSEMERARRAATRNQGFADLTGEEKPPE